MSSRRKRGVAGAGNALNRPPLTASTLQAIACGVVLLVALGLSLRNYDAFQLGAFVDDADYAILASAVASGQAYGLTHGPGPAQPTRFPPGFPLLLAPVAWLFPGEPAAMRFVSLAATLANIVLLVIGWPYLTNGRSRWWGVAIAALYGWSPFAVGYARMVMTEAVFTTCTLASLILTERYVRANAVRPPAAVLLGALAGFTCLIRTIGVLLWCAIVVRLFVSSSVASAVRSLALMCGGAVLLVACVVGLTPVHVSDLFPREYTRQLVSNSLAIQPDDPRDVQHVGQVIQAYATRHIRSAVLPFGGGAREDDLGRRLLQIPRLSWLVGLAVVGLIVLGAAARDGRVSLSVAVFEATFMAVLMSWPGRASRLLYPVQPFLLWHFIAGVIVIARRLMAFSRPSIPAARAFRIGSAAVVIGLLCTASLYKGITDRDSSVRHVLDLRVGTIWLRSNSSTDAVIMATESRIVHLYSGRKTIPQPADPDDANMARAVAQHGVDYVMIAPLIRWSPDGQLVYGAMTRNLMLPLVKTLAAKGELTLVFDSPRDLVKVYRVNR